MMKRYWSLATVLLVLAAPAAKAQPAPPVVVSAPDPLRLAVARQMVAQMVTDASVQRMFSGLDKMMSSQMLAAMAPAGDLAKARGADPYFDERLKRVSKVTFDYIRAMMSDMMPQMREVMATSFARRLSAEELRADLAFAQTPAGQHLFESFYGVMQDPAYSAFMQSFIQRIADDRASLIEKIKVATADLPPPPKLPAK